MADPQADTEADDILDTRTPFTRAAAMAAGIAPRLLRGSRFRRIFRGVYVDASVVETPLQRAQAALKLFSHKAYASHVTAARVHGVPLPALPGEHVTVFNQAHRRAHEGVRVHVAKQAGGRISRASADVTTTTRVRLRTRLSPLRWLQALHMSTF